jgi:hypothetical protein
MHPYSAFMPSHPAMSPEEYVDALYQLCFGRDPDADGRAAWIATLESTGDPTLVLAEMLESDEYQARIDAARPDYSRSFPDSAASPEDETSSVAGSRPGAMTDSAYDDATSFRPAIFGPLTRLHIDPTVVLNDALINTTSGEVTIDEHAFLGHRVMVLAATHDVTKAGIERQRAIPQSGCDIHIGRGAWIASGAIVIGPCTIGANAVIGAGSLVTRDIPANSVAVGSPARVIRQIDISVK